MLKFILTLVLSTSLSVLSCQNYIQGTILDSLKAPVPFCAVGLLNATDSLVVKGNLSDENGRFIFESLAAGIYFIKVNHVGSLDTWSTPITFDSTSKITLEPLVLKSSSINLKEVGILAVREPIEFKNGNITVNIDGSPLAVGNSAFDLLSRLPGVSIENDNILIKGQGGVKVFIDDRVQQMSGSQLINFLKSLNSSVIDKIEIITNPPAKYDASGNAGIINIRTKKIKLVGFSGSINLTYSQGFYQNGNGGISLNYKGRNFSFFSSINANEGIKRYTTEFDRTINYDGNTTHFRHRVIDTYENRTANIDLGADWYVNKNTIVGAKVQLFPGYGINKINGSVSLSDTSSGYDHLVMKKTLPNYWYYINYNFNAEHLFDTLGTKLKFSTDYYNPYYDNYKGNYENSFLNTQENATLPSKDFINNNIIDLKLFSTKLDFEKKLSKTLNLESGVKASYQDVYSDYILQRKNAQTYEYITDPEFTNVFRYQEKIGAAYLTLSKELKKINFQVGLRAENTWIETGSLNKSFGYKRDYFNLFPVLSIDYKKSNNHTFSLTYNKRIDRPNYSLFNPYKSFVDILTSSQGNPHLLPVYGHHAGFNYVYKNTVYNSLTYSKLKNGFASYPFQNDSTKETTEIITNLSDYNLIRYSFFVRKNIKKWWTVSFSFGTYYIDYSGKLNGQKYSLSAIPHYEWLNNTFVFPKDIKLEVTAYYWGPWIGIATRYKARGAASMAIKKSFLKNNLNCSIGINDIFFTEVFNSTTNFQNQNSTGLTTSDTRRLNISVSYNFGKIKAEKRVVEDEDVKGKLSK